MLYEFVLTSLYIGLNRIAVVPKGAFKVMVREKESVAANYIGKYLILISLLGMHKL